MFVFRSLQLEAPMASSCIRQVAASPAGLKAPVLSSSSARPRRAAENVRLHLASGSSRGHSLSAAATGGRKASKRFRVAVFAEAAVETAEVEAEVVPSADADGPPVEVERSEAPPRTGKSRKTKGLKNIMDILHKRAIEAASEGKNIPDIKTGDIVQLRWEVPENKRRVALYRGICIGRQNAGIHTTFRIRRVIAGVGVEMVFPLYSPNIKEIKVINKRKVRRAKLYYLRDKIARLSSC